MGPLSIEEEQRTTVLSDIKKMPNEIVARIFTAGTNFWREEGPSGLPFPVLVSSVCHRWRLLAQSTPELWSLIIPPLHVFNTAEDGERWTSEWIARSGALAVSIIIDDRLRIKGNHPKQQSQAVILGVLRAIGLHGHQLRRLDIWSQHVFPTDLNPVFQNAVQLRQLSLCCGRITQTQILPNSSPHTSHLFSWFARLPRLHKLRLAGSLFPVVSSITTLSVHELCTQYSEVQTIFSTCPNITTLVLPQLLPIAFPPSPTPLIPAPSLKSMAASFKRFPHAESNLPYLVGILHMPNLEYLEVDGDADMSAIFDKSLSSTKIRTLRLTRRPKVHRADQTLLRSLTDLRQLELKDVPAEGLLSDTTATPTVGRKHSISSLFSLSLNSSSSSPGHISCWPLLTEITLDTISQEDVMHLCRFANLNRGVKTIHLSRHANRHLSSSLLRNNDIIYVKEPSSSWKRKGSPDSGINDVGDWLRKLVEVKVFKHSPGMIDREAFPLQELCKSTLRFDS